MPNSDSQSRPNPVALIILDGWGVGPDGPGNAITRARTPNFDNYLKNYISMTLHAAGEAVGLKWGEMGNSEVGHLNIGAGQLINQPQQQIDKAIIDNSFFQNQVLISACQEVKTKQSRLHILGLVSDVGVHATIEHLYALMELTKQQGLAQVCIHVILDGRDAPYNSGLKYIERLEQKINEIGIGQIASISGRFWAMDRDNRWSRTEQAYRAIAEGRSKNTFTKALEAIKKSYQNNIFDEEFEPAVAVSDDKQPVGQIKKNDAVIFYNFRADRARQIARTLVSEDFDNFKRVKIQNLKLVTFTEYEEGLTRDIAFPSPLVENPLAKVISDAGLSQLHIAETEKYAHVTYFINGRREESYPGEERILIASPPVTSYEEKPEMSALEIRERLVRAIEQEKFDFYLVNFANADMVGHTGNFKATVRGLEALDLCLGNIVKTVLDKNGVVFLTADHGNAENMIDINTGDIDKEHSTRPVPFIVIGAGFENQPAISSVPDLASLTPSGWLSDITPTILKVMNLPVPKEMTGRSLI